MQKKKEQPREPHKWHPAQQVVPNPTAGGTMPTWWVSRAKNAGHPVLSQHSLCKEGVL